MWAGWIGCAIPVRIANMMLMVRVKDPVSLALAPCGGLSFQVRNMLAEVVNVVIRLLL